MPPNERGIEENLCARDGSIERELREMTGTRGDYWNQGQVGHAVP